MPNRSVSSGDGGGSVSSAPNPVPVPSKFITSPKGTIDSNSGLFIVQFRDGDGQVTAQYPAPKAASAYKHGAAVNTAETAPNSGGGAQVSSAPAAAPAAAPATSAPAPTKTDSV